MSIRKLTATETEALLSELGNRDCGQGCKCVFCRTFEEGYASGKHDAQIAFERALKAINGGIA